VPTNDSPLVLTIHDMVRVRKQQGDVAIVDAEAREMTYGQLYAQVSGTVGTLNAAGFKRNDRIIVSLPNGAMAAAASVALTSGFTVIPINPNQTLSEYERYLPDLGAKAIVLESGVESAARKVAEGMGIESIELSGIGGKIAGAFSLAGLGGGRAEPEFARPEDLANVMLTSGTTAKPKRVPWTHSNIFWGMHLGASGSYYKQVDRNLILSPLFHGAGISALYRCLYTGSTAICAKAFQPAEFFDLLDRTRPLSFFATPTMHKSIIEMAGRNKEIISRSSLRRITAASASFPVKTLRELENTFGVSVSETYAMTEVGLVGRRPRNLGRDKTGVVEPLLEFRIIDGAGDPVPVGELGEIAIRGPSVFGGYEDDPEENARVFIKGWFRTGDLGRLDGEGNIHLCGRVKEMINRGGEKVAPAEIDEVLLEHPAVREAAAFPVPHPKLGEDVGVAVVLKDGSTVSEADLRAFVSERLAFFKVPARLVFVKEIPKTATGKPSRVGMAERLGVTSAVTERAEYEAPRTETERRLVELLRKVFGEEKVGIKDNFFDLGGFSLMAVKLFIEIEREFGVRLPLSTLFQCPTVGGLAALLGSKGGEKMWQTLVPLQTRGSDPPLFLVHGGDGDVLNFKELVQALGDGRKIYGIQARGLDGREEPEEDLGGMARGYVDRVVAVQPNGPYYLAGFSAGGLIAFEMARQLEARGERAAFVGVIDMDVPNKTAEAKRKNFRRTFFREIFFMARDLMPNSRRRKARVNLRVLPRLRGIWRLGLASVGAWQGEAAEILPADAIILPEVRRKVWRAQIRAIDGYVPGDLQGRVTVFSGERLPIIYPTGKEMGWERYAKGGVDTFIVPGKIHGKQLRSPNVHYLARRMNEAMDRARTAQ